jgi:hypothetical protein
MPDLIKIGSSMHGGMRRAKEIDQTGVPSPFILEFEILSTDYVPIESEVHSELSEYRESGNREFFRVDVDIAISAIINLTSENHVMRDVESIVDDDTVAQLLANLEKSSFDSHHFEVAASISYLSNGAMIDAISLRKKTLDESKKKRDLRLVK